MIYPGQILTIPNASAMKSSSLSGSSGSKTTTSKLSGSGGSNSGGTTSKPTSSQQYTLTVTLNPVRGMYVGGTLTISYTSPTSLGKPLTVTHKGSGSLTLNLAKDSVATFIITTRTGYTYKVTSSVGTWNRSMTSWTYKADKKVGSITIDWKVKK